MSAALVRKSLAIVDPDFSAGQGQSHKVKKVKNVHDLMPENHKVTKKVNYKGRKVKKVDVLKRTDKLTIVEARQKVKSKQQILRENLQKLKQIKKACSIDLDKKITKQIFQRARTRRPVKDRTQPKQEKNTVFTEEDFERFEAEYVDE